MSTIQNDDDDQPEPTAEQTAAAVQQANRWSRNVDRVRESARDGLDADLLAEEARDLGLDGDDLRTATRELEAEIDERQQAIDSLNQAADLRDDDPDDDDDSAAEEVGADDDKQGATP